MFKWLRDKLLNTEEGFNKGLDRKTWSKFNFRIIGIMDYGGFSLNFDYNKMEVEALFINNQYSQAGPKAKKLHDEVVKISGYKETII
jgi:hypothetical protein